MTSPGGLTRRNNVHDIKWTNFYGKTIIQEIQELPELVNFENQTVIGRQTGIQTTAWIAAIRNFIKAIPVNTIKYPYGHVTSSGDLTRYSNVHDI